MPSTNISRINEWRVLYSRIRGFIRGRVAPEINGMASALLRQAFAGDGFQVI